MLFYTPAFAVFFTALVAALIAVRAATGRKALLLVGSYIFYMWWNPAFIALIILSTVVDYVVGARMAAARGDERRRKRLLLLSLCVNLGLLALFKYAGFFQHNVMGLMQLFGYEPTWTALKITLPVGISFYTFQTMSYTIDIYRERLEPSRSPLDFALFVSFFPQLVAGPIVRAADFLPQLERPVTPDHARRRRGAYPARFEQEGAHRRQPRALCRRDLRASRSVAKHRDLARRNYAFRCRSIATSRAIRNIAIGIAALLGYDLPLNFNRPYFAEDPSDFWRRWHISLSTWLRDYLYIPLGGNRGGSAATYRNLMLTMLLGGLWHGASWNFVLWGFLHGGALAVHRVYTGIRRGGNADWAPSRAWPARLLSLLVMQYVVLVTWITFRLSDTAAMWTALRKFVVFDFDLALTSLGLGRTQVFSTVLILGAFAALHIYSQARGGIDKKLARAGAPALVAVGVIAGLCFYYLWPLSEAPFIYFQF